MGSCFAASSFSLFINIMFSNLLCWRQFAFAFFFFWPRQRAWKQPRKVVNSRNATVPEESFPYVGSGHFQEVEQKTYLLSKKPWTWESSILFTLIKRTSWKFKGKEQWNRLLFFCHVRYCCRVHGCISTSSPVMSPTSKYHWIHHFLCCCSTGS